MSRHIKEIVKEDGTIIHQGTTCCDECGADAETHIDPYQQEICGVEVEVDLCSKCYSNAVGDI